MGLFSFIGSLFGGGAQKRGISQAEQAQIDYLNKALQVQTDQLNQTRQDNLPWLTAGTGALGKQSDILGLNGDDAQGASIDALQSSPFYQALYRNGLEANLQNASATGGLRGGNEARSLADFGSDTLATTIDRYLGQLGGVSSQGGATGQALGQFGANYANQVGNLYGQQGQVRAGAALGRAGVTSGMWNSAGGFLDQLASAIPGGGGLGGIANRIGKVIF